MAWPWQAANAWGTLLLIDSPPAAARLSIGPSAWSMPAYPGSRAARALVIPGIDYQTPSGLFASTDLGLGWNLSRRSDIQSGVRLWPQFGREGTQGPRGLNGIGTRIQGQGFLNYQAAEALLLQSTLSYGAGRRHDGAQFEFGATSGVPIGPDLLGIGVAASYANRSFRQSYFGVSSSESIISGLPATTLGSGWQDVSLTLSAEHKLSDKWRISGQFIAARLVGEAARSPITRSRSQLASSVTLWRDF